MSEKYFNIAFVTFNSNFFRHNSFKAQKDLLQQIEQIKATQKKFSVKKVWVEIDDDDGVVEDDCDEFAQFSDVDDLDELELENQLASFTVNDAAESGECIGDAIDIRADSPEIEGLDAIQMYIKIFSSYS